jgi:hypothetical protein
MSVYQRELNWTDSFDAVLGAYIALPPQTILWRQPLQKKSQLYQFSARSENCCIRFCSKGLLRLIDFRYALLILSEHSSEINIDSFTPENILDVCMHMKYMSQDESAGQPSYVIDGIIISTLSGVHIVLFDIDCVQEYSEQIPVSLGKDVEYIHPPCLLCISQSLYIPRLFVHGGQKTSISLSECTIDTLTSNVTKNTSVKLETFGTRHPNFLLDNKESMQSYNSIRWNDPFPAVYGSSIEIPAHTTFWRGYDTRFPAISDRPVYFGEHRIAKEYAKTSASHTLGLFATTKPLKVLDIRFLKILLTDLFHGFNGNAVIKTTVAFGLCSFYHQLRLMQTLYVDSIRAGKDAGYKAMKDVYNSEIEQPGVRVAETSNDGWVMAFLGEVFHGIVDGFIAPWLFTPYQVNTDNHLHPELILFNPLTSGIVQLHYEPQTTPVSVYELIRQQFPSPITLSAQGMKTMYVGRGGGVFIPPVEAFNDLMNSGDEDAIQHYREAKRAGKHFRKRCKFSM